MNTPVVWGPLSGLRVVVTRPRDQAAALIAGLETAGAEAIPVPVIEIVDPPDGGVALKAGLRALRAEDWVVVTSPNGAVRVAAALAETPLADGVRLAVVGPGTKARAEALGLTVDLVPEDAIAEGLLAAFPPRPDDGGRVLLARAEVAREMLPHQLRMAGWNVDEVVAYRTVKVTIDDEQRLACANADAVVFTSGSTAEGLVGAVGADGVPPVVASIGPATSAVAADLGLTVDVEAERHTIPGVVAALTDHLADVAIIHAEPADSADAQWCLEQYYADIDRRFATGLDREAVLSSDPAEVSPPHGLFLVVRLDGRPVGCGCLKGTGDGVADIKRMWLSPDVRGRGLGRTLLDRLVAEGRRLGLRQVRLETNETLTEAIALYRAAGFVEVDPFNDEPHAHYWFVFDLD